MKKMKMMAAALTAAMAFSIAAVPALPQNTAYAAAKTVKANKKYKKAKTVKKGTTKVKCPKGEAQTQYYVKFKAPKTKTYTFVFKHYDDGFKGGESVNCGSFYIRFCIHLGCAPEYLAVSKRKSAEYVLSVKCFHYRVCISF